MSSRSDRLLDHPLPPLGVWVGFRLLLRNYSSGGVHGVWVGNLLPARIFTQTTCAPAFLLEWVLASRAMYDPGQIFQCCLPNGEESLVRDLCR